ncbi:hypothetical protein FRX31_009873 [Thalictrum thalictroides]|uniref:Uncharacterized protein n=1 Tax=Thalictrum thalictroides TaxID=46969 RepID=A0A7J6WT47_THATH|nr:hypothetical protein FRX31_009873 [Thalictrum thalictroides]
MILNLKNWVLCFVVVLQIPKIETEKEIDFPFHLNDLKKKEKQRPFVDLYLFVVVSQHHL